MKNVKKKISIISIIILILLITVFAIFNISQRKRLDRLEQSYLDSERTVENLRESNKVLGKQLESAESRVVDLEGTVIQFEERDKRNAAELGEIGSGLGKVREGLEGVQDGIGYYLSQAKK